MRRTPFGGSEVTVILYTSTEAIRACLGVSARELDDAQITDLRMSDQLLESLEDVLSTHVAAAAAGEAVGATDAEVTVLRRLRLYCQYEAAVLLLPQLQTLLVQKISDGDAEMQRFSKDDLERTKDQITAMRNHYRGKLNADFVSEAFVLPTILAVSPTYDPVTDV